MKIQIITDKSSWLNYFGYINILKNKLHYFSKKVFLCNTHLKLKKYFDVNIILSYSKKIPKKYLLYSKKNIVIHGSDLPKGRGMSPISHQILKGNKKVIFTLFEASKNIDYGNYYFKKKVHFKGDELFTEIKKKQFRYTCLLIKKLLFHVKNRKKIFVKKQKGRSSYFKKRTKKDSEININKNIKSQFNLLRIVDNDNYPAFFKFKKNVYIIKIFKK